MSSDINCWQHTGRNIAVQGILAMFKLREMIMDRVHLEVLHIHFSGFLLILKTRLLILEWVCQRVTSVRSFSINCLSEIGCF
jgi:hypothetical protein